MKARTVLQKLTSNHVPFLLSLSLSLSLCAMRAGFGEYSSLGLPLYFLASGSSTPVERWNVLLVVSASSGVRE